MASKIKLKVIDEIIQCSKANLVKENILPYMKWNTELEDRQFNFLLDTEKIYNEINCDVLLNIKNADFVKNIARCSEHCLKICVNKHAVIEDTLGLFMNEKNNTSPRFSKNVVVDFSSPNIAKPFHFGHLRSTIIGNFVCNINKYVGNNVIKINYLGDWGTQFGLLKVGLNLLNFTEEHVRRNPIRTLYEAYVHANKLAEKNDQTMNEALRIFHDMELADENNPDMKTWELYRQYTIEEISKIYSRLGVHFDYYEWESDYSKRKITDLLNYIKQSGHTKTVDGKLVIDVLNSEVPILKSDGSTLYLTRDIAAANNRYEKFKFHKMFYVVDYSQKKHFDNLAFILNKLNFPYANDIAHVSYGRVLGISTRKGNVMFLDDILNEAKAIIEKKQLETSTTRTQIGEVSDILGISAIVINDLKRRRVVNYEFVWEDSLKINGKTGVRMQYAHCRLVSLHKNSGATLPSACDPLIFKEPESLKLINDIARFEDVIENSYIHLEPSMLVSYAFKLCHSINGAFKVLQIKNQDSHIASQRLLLFETARRRLNLSMKILGLKPLDQM